MRLSVFLVAALSAVALADVELSYGAPVQGPFYQAPNRVPFDEPVLLIPGIGGSQLYFRPKGTTGPGTRAWVVIDGAEFYFRTYLTIGNYSCYPCTDDEFEVFSPADNSGLDSITYLLPSLYLGSYFKRMIGTFTAAGIEPGKSLFGFPYDWRKSVTSHSDALLKRLKDASVKNGGKRVHVVSHSMGGLVLKALFAAHPEEASELVASWTTIGTPHKGAAGKVVNALFQGYALGNPVLSDEAARDFFLGCPACFELFPYPSLEAYRSLTVKAAFKESSIETGVFSDTFRNLATEVYANHTYPGGPGGAMVPRPFPTALVEAAERTREALEKVRLPDTVRYYNIFGAGLPTPFNCSYHVTGNGQGPEALQGQSPQFTFVPGDATVPAASASSPGPGLVPIASLEVPNVEHQALVADSTVIMSVMEFMGAGCDWVGRWQLTPPTADDPSPSVIQVVIASAAAAGARDTLTITLFDSPTTTLLNLTRESPPTVFSGRYRAGTASLSLDETCVSLSGTWTPDPPSSPDSPKQPSKSWVGRRVATTQTCLAGSLAPCDMPFGKGTRTCLPSGTWDQSCRATSCAAGYYRSESTDACAPCPRGTYKDRVGLGSCAPCTALPKGSSQGVYLDVGETTPKCRFAIYGTWDTFEADEATALSGCGWFWKFFFGVFVGVVGTAAATVTRVVTLPKGYTSSLLHPNGPSIGRYSSISQIDDDEEENEEENEEDDIEQNRSAPRGFPNTSFVSPIAPRR